MAKLTETFKFIRNFRSFDAITRKMFTPTDPASLGVIRFLFGLLMLLDIAGERAGSEIMQRWGDAQTCHFPLIQFVRAMPVQYMAVVYFLMTIGAIGIMLGFHFNKSALLFVIPYWYLFVIDKSFWNNHTYLYGLIAGLLAGTCANHYFSIDGRFDRRKHNCHVPYWNYFAIKYQFFILYFLAGVKKSDREWLAGFSMVNLSSHWVFDPFKLFLTTEQTDYLIVHWFGFLFDLTIFFWMLFQSTRFISMIFCVAFHLMNSRLFSIGMFPYVCLATLPLFYEPNWPRKLLASNVRELNGSPSVYCVYEADKPNEAKKKNETEKKIERNFPAKIQRKHRIVTGTLLVYCALQLFLPYSHFITKGYNNWTNGLYGYSWDMMIHAWDTTLVTVKITDHANSHVHYLDPHAWTLNDRWTKHGDMLHQYARCVRDNLVTSALTSPNISVNIDVWCSLNARFQQRMFDPRVDLLRVEWSPWRANSWLMPLLIDLNKWRGILSRLRDEVYAWSAGLDVMFIADFPEYTLENFIDPTLTNVSLTVLDGTVAIRELFASRVVRKGESVKVVAGETHTVRTISNDPACYMYTYVNETVQKGTSTKMSTINSPFPIFEDFHGHVREFGRMFNVFRRAGMYFLTGKSMTTD